MGFGGWGMGKDRDEPRSPLPITDPQPPTPKPRPRRRDLGDFQTPPALVAAVLDALGPIGRCWPRVLEPSCGRGHFLAGLLDGDEPPREIQAIEIQEAHATAAREVV